MSNSKRDPGLESVSKPNKVPGRCKRVELGEVTRHGETCPNFLVTRRAEACLNSEETRSGTVCLDMTETLIVLACLPSKETRNDPACRVRRKTRVPEARRQELMDTNLDSVPNVIRHPEKDSAPMGERQPGRSKRA